MWKRLDQERESRQINWALLVRPALRAVHVEVPTLKLLAQSIANTIALLQRCAVTHGTILTTHMPRARTLVSPVLVLSGTLASGASGPSLHVGGIARTRHHASKRNTVIYEDRRCHVVAENLVSSVFLCGSS
jgi:hypothetical protein